MIANTGITTTHSVCFNVFTGSAEALVASGLITMEQLPGHGSAGKYTRAFYRGQPVRRGVSTVKHDQNYLQVRRISERIFSVYVGLPEGEADKRRAALFAAQPSQHAVQNHPMQSAGGRCHLRLVWSASPRT